MGFTAFSTLSNKSKLLGLDHLRSFAILYVLLFHYQFFNHPNWVNTVGDFGWTGVDLFFVLSGFLIASQLFSIIDRGKTISVREFFIKRFFRIIPPYIVVVCIYFCFPYLQGKDIAPLWRYLTFTTNFGLDTTHGGTFTHSWSLCVEEHFYLILPLCILLFNRLGVGKKAAYLIFALFVGGVVSRYISWHLWVEPNIGSYYFTSIFNEFIYYPTYNRLDSLLVGISIAGVFTFYPDCKQWVNKISNVIMVTGVILLIFASGVCTPQQTFITTIWGYQLIAISYGLIVASIVCPNNIFYSVKSWLTSQLATLSYGMYLSHKIVFNLTQQLLEKAGMHSTSNLMMFCCILSSILCAILLRYTIEKPSLWLRDTFLKQETKKTDIQISASL
jgi:peptidoglycan/LPS O-acetylase OafA/YrhL